VKVAHRHARVQAARHQRLIAQHKREVEERRQEIKAEEEAKEESTASCDPNYSGILPQANCF
jgi:hypothetical protein